MESSKWPKINESNKSRMFISPHETLADALSHVEPKFSTLFNELTAMNIDTSPFPESLIE
jgi:hypothetical protein